MGASTTPWADGDWPASSQVNMTLIVLTNRASGLPPFSAPFCLTNISCGAIGRPVLVASNGTEPQPPLCPRTTTALSFDHVARYRSKHSPKRSAVCR